MKKYAHFLAMIGVATLVMFGLKYLNTYALDHVHYSETRAYMALMMGAAMAVIMLVFMIKMYPNRGANLAIVVVSVLVFATTLWLVRSQATVQDESWMNAMIPHHSIAILTSERAELSDPRVRDLSKRIIEAQRKEIEEMKWLLADLNGDPSTVSESATARKKPAATRPGPPPSFINAGIGEIMAPPGYRIEKVADGLNYPVDITFDADGTAYVAEAGGHTYGTDPAEAPGARIVRLNADGSTSVVYDATVPLDTIRKAAIGDPLPEGLIPPVTGVTWHDGRLYVAHRTRYSTLDPDSGTFETIVDGLPSWGFFHGGKVIFDSEGKMVFFQSTQGNAGPVDRHWMKVINVFNKPGAREIPGEDVTLTGENFPVPVEDPATPGVADKKMSGVFVPVGTTTKKGQVIKGQKICNGAFFRANPDGSGIERIAWGFRSNFGYRYLADGRLITTQNSGNPIPPREIHDDTEPIYEVVPGEWYGWPDYYSSEPVVMPKFGPHPIEHKFVLTRETRERLLKGKPSPPKPLAKLPSHASAEGMVAGRESFGLREHEILVAAMGTIVPHTKKKTPGFKIIRVDLTHGGFEDFLVNESGKPASMSAKNGVERPIQLEWGPEGALYMVDFGRIDFEETGMTAHPGTGVIYRVTRTADGGLLPALSPPTHNKGDEAGHGH